MLRFTLFRFPVTVHWMFWVTCALIGGTLNNIPLLVTFAAAAFVSILIHELGHAFLMRHFRARASILLYALGGLTIPSGARFSRGADILISLAGPVVQVAVGFLVKRFSPTLTLHNYNSPGMILLQQFTYISIAWGVLNLLPIFPLDGGHVLNSILGPRRWRTTLMIGIGCCAVLIVWCLIWGMFYNALIVGMLAYGNINRLKGDRSPTFLDPV